MDNRTQKLLTDLIQEKGKSTVNDQRFLEMLIREQLRDYKRESSCLIAAAREHIPQDLLKEIRTGFNQQVMSVLEKRLIENQGIADENAQWAVETWAVALGLVDANDSQLYSNQVEAASIFVGNENVLIDERKVSIRMPGDFLIPFCYVPAGAFLMGSNPGQDDDTQSDETPQHPVFVDSFWIAKYPITVAQFSAFIHETGYETTAETMRNGKFYMGFWFDMEGANWKHPRGSHSNLSGKDNHPVTQISWFDALAFCKWLRTRTNLNINLPFEHQWEKAARGPDARNFPWGNQLPTLSRCNYDLSIDDTTPVGQYSPISDSPYGAANMAGGVWEWTRSMFAPYPYEPDDGRESPGSRSPRVRRGGAFSTNREGVRCAFRNWVEPNYRSYDSGFRICLYSL